MFLVVNMHFNKSILAFILIFLIIQLLDNPGFSQTKRELEKKKEQLQKDIDYTNQQLNQTKKYKSASLNQLVTLNQQLSYRSELIHTINSQISLVDNQIGNVSTDIDSLDQRLIDLKKQYGATLYSAYKNQGTFSRLMFIFSAADFNQAYKRMRYLQSLSEYRIHQQQMIIALQDSLKGKQKELQEVKTDKSYLLHSQQKEKKQLKKEKEQQVLALNNLSNREKRLRSEIKEKQKQEQLLASKIEDIIRKEIEMARAAARKKKCFIYNSKCINKETDQPGKLCSCKYS